jgi:putative ABC transport system ATP-binding protein
VRIEALEITVALAGKRVLDGASLAIDGGEIATLQGASGSGKSTLLRVMATLIEPDLGMLRADGVDVRTLSPRAYRRRVAFLPQQPPMFEGSVADNVRTGPLLHGATMTADAVLDVLARVGLEGYGDRVARDLSGGEKQRAALARALANAPDALLLDEPTSALDPAAAAKVIALVRSLASGGFAIGIVTHVEEHAAAFGGSRYVLERGRLRRHERTAAS